MSALALVPGAEGLLPYLEKLAVLEKRNGGLRPENARKVIDAVAPFVEKREPRAAELLRDLRDEDPERYVQVVAAAARLTDRDEVVAVLDDAEREACEKFAAGGACASSSYPRDPAAKSHHSQQQMRSEDGKFRESRWRRADPRPKLAGSRFFR